MSWNIAYARNLRRSRKTELRFAFLINGVTARANGARSIEQRTREFDSKGIMQYPFASINDLPHHEVGTDVSLATGRAPG